MAAIFSLFEVVLHSLSENLEIDEQHQIFQTLLVLLSIIQKKLSNCIQKFKLLLSKHMLNSL